MDVGEEGPGGSQSSVCCFGFYKFHHLWVKSIQAVEALSEKAVLRSGLGLQETGYVGEK